MSCPVTSVLKVCYVMFSVFGCEGWAAEISSCGALILADYEEESGCFDSTGLAASGFG
jgi:hypothetical protein